MDLQFATSFFSANRANRSSRSLPHNNDPDLLQGFPGIFAALSTPQYPILGPNGVIQFNHGQFNPENGGQAPRERRSCLINGWNSSSKDYCWNELKGTVLQLKKPLNMEKWIDDFKVLSNVTAHEKTIQKFLRGKIDEFLNDVQNDKESKIILAFGTKREVSISLLMEIQSCGLLMFTRAGRIAEYTPNGQMFPTLSNGNNAKINLEQYQVYLLNKNVGLEPNARQALPIHEFPFEAPPGIELAPREFSPPDIGIAQAEYERPAEVVNQQQPAEHLLLREKPPKEYPEYSDRKIVTEERIQHMVTTIKSENGEDVKVDVAALQGPIIVNPETVRADPTISAYNFFYRIRGFLSGFAIPNEALKKFISKIGILLNQNETELKNALIDGEKVSLHLRNVLEDLIRVKNFEREEDDELMIVSESAHLTMKIKEFLNSFYIFLLGFGEYSSGIIELQSRILELIPQVSQNRILIVSKLENLFMFVLTYDV